MTNIDYERMQKAWPRQKAALTRATKITDEGKRKAAVEKVCIDAVHEWDQIGAWPDDWSLFQRALDDSRHWREQISLDDLVAAADRAEMDRRIRDAEAEKKRVAERYPEHAKLKALDGKNQEIGAFIEWLEGQGYSICEFHEARSIDHPDAADGFYPLNRSVTSWVGQYFGIDPAKIEQEKEAMLDQIRRANAG